MVPTLLKRLIINALHTKSAECRQNDKITKNGVQTIRYYHETAEKCPDAGRVAPISACVFYQIYRLKSNFGAM